MDLKYRNDVILCVWNYSDDLLLDNINFGILFAKEYIYRANIRKNQILFSHYEAIFIDRIRVEKLIIIDLTVNGEMLLKSHENHLVMALSV